MCERGMRAVALLTGCFAVGGALRLGLLLRQLSGAVEVDVLPAQVRQVVAPRLRLQLSRVTFGVAVTSLVPVGECACVRGKSACGGDQCVCVCVCV